MLQFTLEQLALPTKGSMRDGPFGSNLKSSDFVESGIKVIRTQNIKKTGYVDQNVAYVSPEKAVELSRYEFKPGDLVIAKLGVDPGVAAVIPESCGSGIIPADVVRFRGKPSVIDHHYLAKFLNSPKAKIQIQQRSRGSTRTRVNLSALRDILVDVPPLDQQKRIVEILDKASSLSDSVHGLISEKTRSIWSVFNSLFGDITNNSLNFPRKKLGEVVSIKLGQSPPGDSYNEVGAGVPFLQGNAEFTSLYPVHKKWTTEPNKFSKFGDILFSVRAPVGAINISNQEYCIGRGLAAIEPNEGLTQEYLQYALLFMRRILESKATGSTFKAVTGKVLKSLEIPIPPRNLQQTFSSYLSSIRKIDFEASKIQYEELLHSVTQKVIP